MARWAFLTALGGHVERKALGRLPLADEASLAVVASAEAVELASLAVLGLH